MSGKLKAIIVDDEEFARENLRMMVEDFCEDVQIVGVASSAAQARQQSRDSSVETRRECKIPDSPVDRDRAVSTGYCPERRLPRPRNDSRLLGRTPRLCLRSKWLGQSASRTGPVGSPPSCRA